MGCKCSILTREDLTNNFNKELCKKICNSLPERKKTDLQKLKEKIKSKTLFCSQKEKYYIIYLWICENIDYDNQSFFQEDLLIVHLNLFSKKVKHYAQVIPVYLEI